MIVYKLEKLKRRAACTYRYASGEQRKSAKILRLRNSGEKA